MSKKKKKIRKAKMIVLLVVLLFDVLFVPVFVNFISIMINNIINGSQMVFEFNIQKSILNCITVQQDRTLFLVLQGIVLLFIISLLWSTKVKKIEGELPEVAGNGQHGTARWQTKKEKDENTDIWMSDEPLDEAGLVFGMEKVGNKEKIYMEVGDVHSLIIGTTRSGKSRKQLLPTIWMLAKAGESMVVGDPKGELFIMTRPYLIEQGFDVVALNLRDPLKGNKWNLLEPINQAVDSGDTSKAAEIAWDIAHMVRTKAPSSNTDPLWINGEESTIAALILLTVLESEFKFQRHMGTVYFLLSEYGVQDEDGKVPVIEFINELDPMHPAKLAFGTARLASYKTRASFFTSALASLRLFADPNIMDMCYSQDHNLEDLGRKKTAVFLIVPDEKTTRNVLASIYIDQTYQALVKLANEHGGQLPKRVNFVLDEWGNLPAIPNFTTKLTVAGGRRIRFINAVQGVGQIKDLYEKGYDTILSNFHTWSYILTSDDKTAEKISNKLGKYTCKVENYNSSFQEKSNSVSNSAGQGLAGRPLLMADEVSKCSDKESIIWRVRKEPAKYNFPDLSEYLANRDFGFTNTGNIKMDKANLSKIVLERWNSIEEREREDVEVWRLPMANQELREEPIVEESIKIADGKNQFEDIDDISSIFEEDLEVIEIENQDKIEFLK